MKQELARLYNILEDGASIKTFADEVYQLLQTLGDDEREGAISLIRAKVQLEAERAFIENNGWGAAYMATGTGKSKIAIDLSKGLVHKDVTAKVLLSVPTEKLRDENWHEEYTKWGMPDVWEHNVERCCYASLNKYKGRTFDLVILDEGHNITENNSIFFENNIVKSLIILTATKPRDSVKLEIFRKLGVKAIYELSLDEAVKLGLVAPYEITVVTMQLDNTKKYIPAGSKAKPFLNTEKAQYGYLSARLNAMPNQMGFIQRMQFIYNLRSKTEVAKALLNYVIPEGLRTLIFCGSKEQANEVCEHRYYSKPSPPKKLPENPTPFKVKKYEEAMAKYQAALFEYQGDKYFDAFKAGEIYRLSCVNALNEGHNIDDLDVGFIIQVNSNEKDLIQRIGRLIRYRAGHIGKIIILCVEDSIDKDWVRKATANLSTAKIRYIELSHLRMGIDTISFD